ncbi:phytanoyl-CoA dioxygenase [Hymenobacter persicinus]|uniref:Phytanoyl-CoA dioxygenase n=2 Tax=Hymenobacter persicinus TaxID=2025506 RepID=A0A4Q5LD75_9BACT|nr:phytanoyl-CoA dioxygenase [Hymenobacter persicinus]
MGSLGVRHLKRFWARQLANGTGQAADSTEQDWRFDNLVLNALGLALGETLSYLMQARPDFAEFERWVLARNEGPLDAGLLARLNSTLAGQPYTAAALAPLHALDALDDVLSPEDLRHWDEHGYVIVRNAVSREQARATEQAVWEMLEMRPDDVASWYEKPIGRGIMMDFYHHPTLRANRHAPRIQKAYAQLWQTSDLWATTDRTSFNPPETPALPHQGFQLHWDVSLQPPFHFGTQGLLYLCDTPAEQGAFRCVPGFHRRLESWLRELPAGTDPRDVTLDAQAVPIAAQAGDFIIWHHFLPHGSSPNRGTYPRIVQYLNMYPVDFRETMAWR